MLRQLSSSFSSVFSFFQTEDNKNAAPQANLEIKEKGYYDRLKTLLDNPVFIDKNHPLGNLTPLFDEENLPSFFCDSISFNPMNFPKVIGPSNHAIEAETFNSYEKNPFTREALNKELLVEKNYTIKSQEAILATKEKSLTGINAQLKYNLGNTELETTKAKLENEIALRKKQIQLETHMEYFVAACEEIYGLQQKLFEEINEKIIDDPELTAEFNAEQHLEHDKLILRLIENLCLKLYDFTAQTEIIIQSYFEDPKQTSDEVNSVLQKPQEIINFLLNYCEQIHAKKSDCYKSSIENLVLTGKKFEEKTDMINSNAINDDDRQINCSDEFSQVWRVIKSFSQSTFFCPPSLAKQTNDHSSRSLGLSFTHDDLN